MVTDSVKLALQAAIKIRDMVVKYRSNNKECERFLAFMDTLSKQLKLLQEAPIRMHPMVCPTIERLKDALERTRSKVENVKNDRKALLRFLMADDITAELDGLTKVISEEMLAVVVVVSTNTDLEVQGMRQDMGQGFITLHQHMDEMLYDVLCAFLPGNQQLEGSTQILGTTDSAYDVSSTGIPKRYSWSDLNNAIASSDGNKHYRNNMLGGGSSSSVYQAKLLNETVAIKNFTLDQGVRACFVRELELVLKLQHPNIVKLLGYYFEYKESLVVNANGRVVCDPIGGLGLVTSHYEQSLDEFNKTGDHGRVVWPSILKIIQGIAMGVRYLHHQNVVHLDLKPENILLDAEMTPKITNFGKAREVEHATNEITVENFYTGKYTAPELCNEHTAPSISGKVFGAFSSMIGIPKASETHLIMASTKSDVYSFGVIILETIGLKCSAPSKDDRRPIDPKVWDMRLQESELMDLFDPKRVAGKPQQKAARWCAIVGLMCCLPDPANRPSMGRVIDMIGWCTQEEISLLPEDSTSITLARDNNRMYNVLTEDVLREQQKVATDEVMSALAITRRGVAELLLRHYSSWSAEIAVDMWFHVKDDLVKSDMKFSSEELRCIGNECSRGNSTAGLKFSAGCYHYYCRKCWRQEVHKAVVRLQCLSSLKCPDPSCQVPVTRELVENLADGEAKAVYDRLVLRSYVDDSGGRIKWCPGPGCSRALEFLGGVPADSEDVFYCGFCSISAARA